MFTAALCLLYDPAVKSGFTAAAPGGGERAPAGSNIQEGPGMFNQLLEHTHK